MAKYLGMLLLLITLFAIGCGGPETATQEEATQGMEDLDSMLEKSDADANAAQ